MSITTTCKQFTIKASYKGNKVWECSNNDKVRNFHNHMIKVTNINTQQSITFEFWNSIAKGEITEEQEVLSAFYCFVSDSLAGMETFSNFCSEFGHDEDSRSAEKTWEKCQKQCQKFTKVFDIENNDIYDFINELQEIAG
jgi:hypothetical protein